jgi:hypothetical protein
LSKIYSSAAIAEIPFWLQHYFVTKGETIFSAVGSHIFCSFSMQLKLNNKIFPSTTVKKVIVENLLVNSLCQEFKVTNVLTVYGLDAIIKKVMSGLLFFNCCT